ncbi:prephenate dehydrogenase [Salipaludibacillus agaradhaerens]|uniref:prephenate dehydrogenase n=1 Tax=Salipaludibacillus agaradhaerens TaxID=76935 RepID=UPI002151E4ED|nr:prephenate dehydrogenase [Salipaludibacillus agaradhaerens]MCR6118622.1 prephenate dehydrogenase [Salipaludibacillus agaradhaerens]UJW57707.1 prephenate dehydrogenase [Bacillus sp. A116_S68]
MTRRLLVVGLGLIGGSLALAVKNSYPETIIMGYDVNKKACKLAKSLQIIDEIVESLAEEAPVADMIIISAPVESTINIIEQLKSLPLKQGAIVTDVGSTKASVVAAGKPLFNKGVYFIGGHPMAGSHKTGVEAARERLFENAFYILTPTDEVPSSKLIELQDILKGTKAKFIQLDPVTHDRYAGLISHLPHIIASGLVHQVAKAGEKDAMVMELAAGGFRDITRIASASPSMWRDILLHNKEELLPMLKEWKAVMTQVEDMLLRADEEQIYSFFSGAKESRDLLPSKKRGALMPFYDLFVDIPDHPGVISDVTAILAEERISLTNIRIIEAREDIMGVLRLSFRSEEDLTLAKDKLNRHLYDTYEVL